MIPAEEHGGETFEGSQSAGFADFSSLTPEGAPQLESNRALRNQEAAKLFKMLLEEESQSGHPMPEGDEAPEMSTDIQAIDLQKMDNYMDIGLGGKMADGRDATQMMEIAQDKSGQWLYKDTITLENGKTIINTVQAATLALLRSKILQQLHQGKTEKVGMLDESDEDEPQPTDLTYELQWDQQEKGYHLIITSRDRQNIYGKSDDVPEELQEMLSEQLAPYWVINFNNQNAFIQKSEIYFGSFFDQLWDQAWDKDLSSDFERPKDDPVIDNLVSWAIKDYNRLKVPKQPS